jgi:UDP-N-acetylglucosamine--N-acetylmuramyl-(pentapeptide) pyrophosphoryl-undecaprenol N-acetylglucosamine transferase
MKVLIAAGGTAGHVVPALAVADTLRADGVDVEFAGGERAEAQLVPAAGYPFHRVPAVGLNRRNPLKALRALLKAVRGLGTALALLRRLKPDVVMGGGGYVAGPVGLAAVLLRVPLVLTEADSHIGIANRALAPFARRVCLAFAVDGRSSSKYLVTGRPVAPPVTDRAAARAEFGIGTDETCVLVFGGSLGARTINQAAIEAFRGATFRVLHVSGERDEPALAPRVPGPYYVLRAYVQPFGNALAAADLVVARAGGSVFELAAYGLPAVLIPYPHATADHQTGNAHWMADAGAAVIVADADLTPARLASEVGTLLGDRARLAAMARASGALARPDAAAVIASEIRAAV